MEIIIAKKFKILKKISQGAFGQIYHSININTGQQLAVKLEKIDTKYPQIISQAKILTQLLNNSTLVSKGVPNLYFYGREGDYNVMVMDLLGQNIENILKRSNNQNTFSLKTTLMLFQQMIKKIQYIHLKEFLHRDVKPENFVIGREEKKQKIFLIDFGLSKRYVKNGVHIPYVEGRSMVGTVRYASVNTHLGIQPTRRDDLQSLIYIMYYFLYGKLPWQGITALNLQEKYKKILAIKIENKPENFFKNLPNEINQQFIQIFKHIRGLKFDQKPNYEFMKLKIKQCFTNLNIENDYLFDWAGQGKMKQKKQSPIRIRKTATMSQHKSGSKQPSSTQHKRKNSKVSTTGQQKKQKEQKVLKDQNSLIETLQRLKGVKISSPKLQKMS